jgi:hypothetical protein
MALDFNSSNGGAKKSDVQYMKLEDGENVFRILPSSLLPGYTYWVNGGGGKQVPFECLQFNPETERFDNTISCPIREANLRNPTDAKKPLASSWSYKCLVINKKSGKIEVLQLKKGIMEGIKDAASQMGINPTDVDTGTWITVVRKKTGPLAYNVDYTVQQLKCRSEPLSDELKELASKAKSIETMFPRETYEAQKARLNKLLSGESSQSNNDSAEEALSELGD